MIASYFINSPDNKIVQNTTTEILSRKNALAFHKTLKGYKSTPLVSLPGLARKYGVGNIYLKDESHRFGLNAFKALGAVFAIDQLLATNPHLQTFCTATDGNHGKAVAWGASLFGKKSVIYVPHDTTENRMKAIEAYGARVEKVNGNYDDACARAESMSNANGWQLVQDMAWQGYEEIPANIVAGYMSLFVEMEDTINTLPKAKIDVVFVQAGVGSFAAAAAFYYLNRYGGMRPKIVIVEPLEADAIFSSFVEGKVTTSRGNATTIMAGLNCGTPSLGAWDLLKSGVDVSLKIDDGFAREAMRELYYPVQGDQRVISGESGSAGLAGFMAIVWEKELEAVKQALNINDQTNILLISTEGDTDKKVFEEVVGIRHK